MPRQPGRPKKPVKFRKETDNFKLYSCAPRQLPHDALPTNQDVDLAMEWFMCNHDLKEADAVDQVAGEVVQIWAALSPSTKVRLKKNIVKGLKRVRTKRRVSLKELSIDDRFKKPRLLNNGKRKKYHKVGITNDYKNEVFDIAAVDQSTKVKSTKVVKSINQFETVQLASSSDSEAGSESEDPEDCDFVEPSSSGGGGSRSRKAINPRLQEVSDQFGFSSAALASVHNATAAPGQEYTVSGARKARKRSRLENVPDFTGVFVDCIAFDEKEDDTLTPAGDSRKQEHTSVILYPGGKKAGHFTPKGSTGKDLGESLVEFLKERNVCLDHVHSLATDGCEKMMGWRTGAHVTVERILGRPLQRISCFFHHLECSFKSIFRYYGGVTSSGTTVTPGFWKFLEDRDIHKRPLVDFKAIPNPELLQLIDSMDIDALGLSTDHTIFISLMRLVITGDRDHKSNLWKRKIGKFVKSRFTTAKTRLARYYVSCDAQIGCDQVKLERSMHYLVFVWAPTFLESKKRQKYNFQGPQLLLLEVKLSKAFLSDEELEIYTDSLSFNGQMCHPENIILGLLASPERADREQAVNIITAARSARAGQAAEQPLRTFKRDDHKVNLNFTSMIEYISEFPDDQDEPPATKHIPNDELLLMKDFPYEPLLPLTTVDVERAVKETTRISKLCSNPKERDGIMVLSQKAREYKLRP